jgi:Zn ribbon nucleic-acid-binding protein
MTLRHCPDCGALTEIVIYSDPEGEAMRVRECTVDCGFNEDVDPDDDSTR